MTENYQSKLKELEKHLKEAKDKNKTQ